MSFDALRRAYRGALSRGYGYEAHSRGQNVRADEVAGYFIDYRPKISSYAAHSGEPLYPADLAQLALGWWERVVLDEQGASPEFMALCHRLERAAEAGNASLLWPYGVRLAKYNMPVPWYSGMAQGQIASVFVRAWSHTGNDRYGDLALRSIEPLLEPGRERMVTITSNGPVLEESGPSTPPSHILNGWIFALWGVREVSVALADARAANVAAETTACLARTLPRYDAGWWSKYSLYPHPLPDLAKPFYHRLHITQLDILHEVTGLAEFGRWADRWRSFDRKPTAIAAVASKIPFAVTNRVARRRERAPRTSSWRDGFSEGGRWHRQLRRRARHAVQECAAAALRWAGLEAIARRTYARGKVGILVYHDPSPKRLEEHLRFLSRRYRFVSMTHLSTALVGGDWSSIPVHSVVVTFDDGHRSNRELAPLFERFEVQPTIYLCSGVVRGDGRFWFRLPGVDPEPLKLLSPSERRRLLAARSSQQAGEQDGRHALTPDEVRELAGAVELGSHTVSHAILPLCTTAEALEEILASRADVAELAGSPCIHFSFPNGDYTQRELDLVREAGYVTGRTTEIGWNGPHADRFRLKIVSLADDASVNVLAAHLAGVLVLRRLLPSLIRRRRLAARAGKMATQ